MDSDIRCVGDLLDIMRQSLLNEVAYKEVWLRGVTDITHEPQPGLFREPWFKQDPFTDEEHKKRKTREWHFIQDYKLRAANLLQSQITDGNLYFIMRHYKAPTRLLDWTTNPLTALYFACQEGESKKEEGLVWIMNPFNLSENQNEWNIQNSCFQFHGVATVSNPIYQHHIKSLFEWKNSQNQDYVFPVRPSFFDRRIKIQTSSFTFHANDKENGILDQTRNKTLKKYTVDKASVRKDLSLLKIDDFTIYEDLESLSSAMNGDYSKRYS